MCSSARSRARSRRASSSGWRRARASRRCRRCSSRRVRPARRSASSPGDDGRERVSDTPPRYAGRPACPLAASGFALASTRVQQYYCSGTVIAREAGDMQHTGTATWGRRILMITLTVVAVAAAPARADWPVYGHDLANTRHAPGEGPTPSEARSLKQAWAFASPTGDFTGTPVVADGVVLAGDQSGTAYALDAVSGKKLWSRDLGAPIHASAAIDTAAPGGPIALVPVG